MNRYSEGWTDHRGIIPDDVPPATEETPMMSDQLSRDDLLKQRLWAATNDCSALLKELAAMVDNPPHAAESQEEHMGYIESALRSVRYNLGRLRSYKP